MFQRLGIHDIHNIRPEIPVANSIAGCRKLPESVGRIDAGVGDCAGVLGRVNETEVISA